METSVGIHVLVVLVSLNGNYVGLAVTFTRRFRWKGAILQIKYAHTHIYVADSQINLFTYQNSLH